jgi:hypothetical protein
LVTSMTRYAKTLTFFLWCSYLHLLLLFRRVRSWLPLLLTVRVITVTRGTKSIIIIIISLHLIISDRLHSRRSESRCRWGRRWSARWERGRSKVLFLMKNRRGGIVMYILGGQCWFIIASNVVTCAKGIARIRCGEGVTVIRRCERVAGGQLQNRKIDIFC